MVGKRKQVCINTESERALSERSELLRVIGAVNLVIPKLQKIGLADTIDEICMNSAVDTRGLITNLATKYVNTGKVTDKQFAPVLARSVIENSLIPSPDVVSVERDSGLDWHPVKTSVYPLIKYRECVEYKAGVLRLVNEERLYSQFGVWVSGVAADNFLKFIEALGTLRRMFVGVLPGDMLLPGVPNMVGHGLELRDNLYTEYMFSGITQ